MDEEFDIEQWYERWCGLSDAGRKAERARMILSSPVVSNLACDPAPPTRETFERVREVMCRKGDHLPFDS